MREYPLGVRGSRDVDSGPVIFGASPAASAVAVAAASVNGDTELATALTQAQSGLFLGTSWRGRRCSLFGAMPALDAFIAWTETLPPAPPTTWPHAVKPWRRWPAHLLCLLLVAALWYIPDARLPPPRRHRSLGACWT